MKKYMVVLGLAGCFLGGCAGGKAAAEEAGNVAAGWEKAAEIEKNNAAETQETAAEAQETAAETEKSAVNEAKKETYPQFSELAAQVQEKLAQKKEMVPVLDFDGSDGYEGEYVLVYNPDPDTGKKKDMGTLEGLLETEIPYFAPLPEEEKTEIPVMPLISEEELTEGEPDEEDPWGIGFEREIYFYGDSSPIRPGEEKKEVFRVAYTGNYCRVWSPVEDAYQPLESIDEKLPAYVAGQFDRDYSKLREVFGEIPELDGGKKVNILCYKMQGYFAGGMMNPFDLMDQVEENGEYRPGNHMAMIHINTGAAKGSLKELETDKTRIFEFVAHETQHLLHLGRLFAGKEYRKEDSSEALVWLSELSSSGAELITYPGGVMKQWWPFWYTDRTVPDFYDILSFLKEQDAYAWPRGALTGESPFRMTVSQIGYVRRSILAMYLRTQSEDDAIFRKVQEIWESGAYATPGEAAAAALGYASFGDFVRDFSLAQVLHTDQVGEGKYNILPGEGYDPEQNYGFENPMDLLYTPIVTHNHCYIEGGGSVMIRPAGEIYEPPADADPSLQYVGIKYMGEHA